MNQHTVLTHTLIRHAHVDSPESARRREQLLWLEREARAARRRRRRERIRRAGNAVIAFHGKATDDRTRRIEAPDLRQALR
jgi:hypothetical protein